MLIIEEAINQAVCTIEEYIIIFRAEFCIRPPTAPTKADLTINIFSIKGCFCQEFRASINKMGGIF